MSLNSGKYLETGSFSKNRPSSASIITPTLVMALVMEAIRKIASLRMSLPASISNMPKRLK